ncbi:hypothetical protein [Streptomyces sp. NPDC029003]
MLSVTTLYAASAMPPAAGPRRTSVRGTVAEQRLGAILISGPAA